MELKTGEIYQETSTGREFVLVQIAEHPTGEVWVGFQNLASRRHFTVPEAQFRRDFEAKTSP